MEPQFGYVSYKIDGLGDYSGAGLVGSIAGAFAGTSVTWVYEVSSKTGIANLVRSLDHRAAAVGAALALAFSLGPTGNDIHKADPTGILVGIFIGMLTAAITSSLTRLFGGSLAGALKSAMAATVASAFSFLFGFYLAVFAGVSTGLGQDSRGPLLLLANGLASIMASSAIPGAISHTLPVLQNGAIVLVAIIGTMTACSITTVVCSPRAGSLTLMLGFVYAVLGLILGTLFFPVMNDANFEGAIAGGLAGVLAGACVGLGSTAFKGVTAGLVGGCLAAALGVAVAPVIIRTLNRIVGAPFGAQFGVQGQLDPGLLGAVFGGVLGGFFLNSFSKRLGEVWGEISVGIVSGFLAFMLILATEVAQMSALKVALRAVTVFIPSP